MTMTMAMTNLVDLKGGLERAAEAHAQSSVYITRILVRYFLSMSVTTVCSCQDARGTATASEALATGGSAHCQDASCHHPLSAAACRHGCHVRSAAASRHAAVVSLASAASLWARSSIWSICAAVSAWPPTI